MLLFNTLAYTFIVAMSVMLFITYVRNKTMDIQNFAFYCVFGAAFLFMLSLFTGAMELQDLAPEIIGLLLDTAIVVFIIDHLKEKKQVEIEEERKRKQEKEEREREKRLLKEFLSNYLGDLIETASKRFYLFFMRHERDYWEFLQVGPDDIEFILENIDTLIEEDDFYRVLREDEVNHEFYYSERYIHKIDGEKILVWSPEFDNMFRIPTQKRLEHFLQLFHSVIPESLKEILLPLNNVLLEFNRLDIQLIWWGKRPEKFMKEEQKQWLTERLTVIGQSILKLMEYRGNILEEKKAG